MSDEVVDEVEYDGANDFVHLHGHTIYSTLDGVATPEELFSTCQERGWPALAVTEHGNMASVPDNYFAAQKYGIQYIPGCEIYFNDYELVRQGLVEKDVSLKDIENKLMQSRIRRNRHLTVLVKNEVGFHNLIELTTQAHKTGYYYKPRIWFDKLAEYSEGLIILSGCLNGPISYEIDHNNLEDKFKKGAIDYIKKFKEVWGDDYYIELQMPCLENKEDFRVFWKLAEIADHFGIKPVITNDYHYLNREDFQLQKLMMAIAQDTTVDDPNLFHVNSDEQFLKTRGQLFNTFDSNEYSEVVDNSFFELACDTTLEIAEKCKGFEPDTSPKSPSIEDADRKLEEMVMNSLKEKGLYNCDKKALIDNKMVTYKEQAEIELKRFRDKEFSSYFLITADLIKYSKDNGWPVGPRGSVGGSLVCYLLGIHDLDPLAWGGLSFNRFLSPARGGVLLNLELE